MSILPAAELAPALAPYAEDVRGLIETGQDFHRRGWSLGTSSNYSVVVEKDPLTLLMTGSGFDKGRLTPDQFVRVDGDSRSLDAGGPKPSAEGLLHTTLVKYAGAGSVLHTHSIHGTVLSEAGLREQTPLKIAGYEMLKGLTGITTHETAIAIEIFPNTQDIPTLAEVIARRLQDPVTPLRHGFLIAGHGLYTWGANLAEARRHIEVLEFLFEVTAQRQLLYGRS